MFCCEASLWDNARWYDPSLGRFASDDSIVPDGVQGYDRYAYGLNNPVKYTDPSGHCAVNGDDWCFDHQQNQSDLPELLSGQDDPTRLTNKGQQMYDAYERVAGLCGQPEYWWRPDCSQSFTSTDFMIIVLSGEFAPFFDAGTNQFLATAEDVRMLETAAANWFSDNCLGHVQYGNSCAGPTENAIFNWVGENLESGMRLFYSNPTTQYASEIKGLATTILKSVLSVSPIPSQTDPSSPVHWANASYYRQHYGAVPSEYVLLSGGDAFYVVSYNEEYRMCGYSQPCPPR